MVRSLAVILVPLVVLTVLMTRTPEDHPVTVVDYQPMLQRARAEAPYPVLAPVGLPSGWRATRVSWWQAGDPALNGEPAVRNQWELGFLSPNDIYLAVVQGDRLAETLIEDETRDGAPDGESAVGDTTWQRRLSADGRTRSLVSERPEVTTIVVGDTSYQALEAYAGTLRSG
jgi:hypothetical protein